MEITKQNSKATRVDCSTFEAFYNGVSIGLIFVDPRTCHYNGHNTMMQAFKELLTNKGALK